MCVCVQMREPASSEPAVKDNPEESVPTNDVSTLRPRPPPAHLRVTTELVRSLHAPHTACHSPASPRSLPPKDAPPLLPSNFSCRVDVSGEYLLSERQSHSVLKAV